MAGPVQLDANSGFDFGAIVNWIERRGGVAVFGFLLMTLSGGVLKYGSVEITLAGGTPYWVQLSFMVFGALVLLLGIYVLVRESLAGARWLFPLIALCWIGFTGLVAAGVIEPNPNQHTITRWGYDHENQRAKIEVDVDRLKKHEDHELWMFVRRENSLTDEYSDTEIDLGGPWRAGNDVAGKKTLAINTPTTSRIVAPGEIVFMYLGCIRPSPPGGRKPFHTIEDFISAGGEIIDRKGQGLGAEIQAGTSENAAVPWNE